MAELTCNTLRKVLSEVKPRHWNNNWTSWGDFEKDLLRTAGFKCDDRLWFRCPTDSAEERVKNLELLCGGNEELLDTFEATEEENKKLRKCIEYQQQCLEIIPQCSSDSAIKGHAKRGFDYGVKCLEKL